MIPPMWQVQSHRLGSSEPWAKRCVEAKETLLAKLQTCHQEMEEISQHYAHVIIQPGLLDTTMDALQDNPAHGDIPRLAHQNGRDNHHRRQASNDFSIPIGICRTEKEENTGLAHTEPLNPQRLHEASNQVHKVALQGTHPSLHHATHRKLRQRSFRYTLPTSPGGVKRHSSTSGHCQHQSKSVA